MRARTAFALALLVATTGLSLATPSPVAAAVPSAQELRLAAGNAMKATLSHHRHAKVCSTPSTHHASCNAIVDLNVSGNISPNTVPWGYGPAALQAAYQLPSASAGSGQTVAIVDASDLRPPKPIWPPTARSTGYPPALPPTAASAR